MHAVPFLLHDKLRYTLCLSCCMMSIQGLVLNGLLLLHCEDRQWLFVWWSFFS